MDMSYTVFDVAQIFNTEQKTNTETSDLYSSNIEMTSCSEFKNQSSHTMNSGIKFKRCALKW